MWKNSFYYLLSKFVQSDVNVYGYMCTMRNQVKTLYAITAIGFSYRYTYISIYIYIYCSI